MSVDEFVTELAAPPTDPLERDVWLAELEGRIAASLSTWIGARLPGVLRGYADSLVSAGNEDPLFELAAEFETVVNQAGETLGGIHLSGSLSAWVQSPAVGDAPADFGANWLQVTNLEAVEYQRTATNRLANASDAMWRKVRAQTVDGIHTGMDNEDLTVAIQRITKYSEQRANTIARTETVAAYNGGNYVGAQALGQYGPAEKWWLAAEDARTRPSHNDADGQVVPFAGTFTVGGVPMSRPHDPGAPARETVNCRCVMNLLYPGDLRPDGSLVGEPMVDAPPPPTPDGGPEYPTLDDPEAEPTVLSVEQQQAALDWWAEQAAKPKPTDEVQAALDRFVAGNHTKVNAALRDGKDPDWLDHETQLLDDAVARGVHVPDDVALFRAAGGVPELDVGDTVFDRGYSTFTVDERVARQARGEDGDAVLFQVTDRDPDMRFAVGGDNELVGERWIDMDVIEVLEDCLGLAADAIDWTWTQPTGVPVGLPDPGAACPKHVYVGIKGAKATDEELTAWIKQQLDAASGKPPSAAQLLKQWKAQGGAANDVRFRRLYKAATEGDRPQVALPTPAVARGARPWDKPIRGADPDKALNANAKSQKALRRYLKGELGKVGEFGSGTHVSPSSAKAEVARKLTRRIHDEGHRLRPKAWHDAKARGFDPDIAIFRQSGYGLEIHEPLSDLYRGLSETERALFREGIDPANAYAADVRSLRWPTWWRDRYQQTMTGGGRLYAGEAASEKLTEARVAQLVHQWAITSNDANATSLNLQRAAVAEFDLDPSTLADWQINQFLRDEMDQDWALFEDEYRIFLRAMYDETQQMFRDAGVSEVGVVRGFSFSSHSAPDWAYTNGEVTGVPLRPMSSFAWNQRQADKFAGGVHTYARIPVERIIGSPRSGFGCLDETELVVLGGDNTMTVQTRLRRPYTPPPPSI